MFCSLFIWNNLFLFINFHGTGLTDLDTTKILGPLNKKIVILDQILKILRIFSSVIILCIQDNKTLEKQKQKLMSKTYYILVKYTTSMVKNAGMS